MGSNIEGSNLEGSNVEGSNMEGSNVEGLNLRANVRGPNTRQGCLTYDVALCPTDYCWNLFHNSKLGVV